MRDYLLVTAMYENGSRPGPIENAKMSRFKQAEYTKSKDRWTIIVDEHKTMRHQGPAEITMVKRLYGYTKLYVQHVRPCFVASGKEHLFIKDDGHAFCKGTIGRRVAEVFKRAGVRRDVRVTATKIRKLFSSSAAEMSPTKKRATNMHMRHNETTADSNYVLKLNTNQASTAHQLMRSIINESDQPDQGNSSSKAPKRPREPDSSDSSSADDYENLPLKTVLDKAAEKEDDEPTSVENLSSQLDAGDKVVVESVFKKYIESGKLLTRHDARSKMWADPYLRRYVVKKEKVKKICDYLRYKTNHVRQLMHVPEEGDEQSKVATLSTRSRRQWDANATRAIEEHFSRFPKMPARSSMLKFFEEDPVLSHVLKSEGPNRCYEKVKNLFKKRSQQE